MNIKITVKRKLPICGDVAIVCNNSDYTVIWELDEEWSGYDTKTMRTVYKDGTYTDTVFTGDTVALPVVTVPGTVKIGLYAGDIRTSRPALIRAFPSITTDGGAPAAPSDDVYNQIMELIKQMGTVSPDEIAKVVADYLAEHPVTETDPTVPDWAKAENKPTYTAEEVGAATEDDVTSAVNSAWANAVKKLAPMFDAKQDKGDYLTADDLQDATNAALAQAKASGEFDGADGAPGVPGKAGTDGTPGIVVSSGEPTDPNHPVWLDPDGDATPDNPLDITGAAVGQIVKIAAVDENGIPTAFEPIDVPSGGGSEEWELINSFTVSEENASRIIKIDKDSSGNAFSLKAFAFIANTNSTKTDGSLYGWFCVNGRGTYNSGTCGFTTNYVRHPSTGAAIYNDVIGRVFPFGLVYETVTQRKADAGVAGRTVTDVHEVEFAGYQYEENQLYGTFQLWGVRK